MCPLERNLVVLALVVVPPLADARGLESGGEKDDAFGQLPLHIFQPYEERKSVPRERRYSGRRSFGRERRRQGRKRANVPANDFRSRLPVIQRKPQGHTLFEGDVFDEDGSTKGGWARTREDERFHVHVCELRGFTCGYGGGLSAIDFEGKGRFGRVAISCSVPKGTVESRRVVSFRFCLCIVCIVSTNSAGTGRFREDDDTLEVILPFWEVNGLWGYGSRWLGL